MCACIWQMDERDPHSVFKGEHDLVTGCILTYSLHPHTSLSFPEAQFRSLGSNFIFFVITREVKLWWEKWQDLVCWIVCSNGMCLGGKLGELVVLYLSSLRATAMPRNACVYWSMRVRYQHPFYYKIPFCGNKCMSWRTFYVCVTTWSHGKSCRS